MLLKKPKIDSFILSFLWFVANVSFLSHFPQTGDGGEQVLNAQFGGILHPPGFPIQMWLNHISVYLSPWSAAYTLSLLSLISSAVSLFVFSEILILLHIHHWIRYLSVVGYATFLPLWLLALQPEVFALTYLFIIIVIFLTLLIDSRLSQGSMNHVYFYGLAVLQAMALAQHPITIVMLPALSYMLFHWWRHDKIKNGPIVYFMLILCVGTLLFYSSLLMAPLAKMGWPNWGNISSFESVFNHMLRRDYGMFHLSSATETTIMLSGLSVLSEYLRSHMFIWMVFSVMGISLAFRSYQNQSRMMMMAIILSSALLFLIRAKLPIHDEESRFAISQVLERFIGTAVIPLMLLAAIGAQWWDHHNRFLARLLCVVFISLSVFSNLKVVRQFDSPVSEIYRQGLEQLIPKEAIYIANSDYEACYGIQRSDGSWFFPIQKGLFHFSWYQQRILRYFYPKYAFEIGQYSHIDDFVRFLLKKGEIIVTSSYQMAHATDAVPLLYGLVYIVDPKNVSEFSWESVKAIRTLCPLVEKMPPIAKRGNVVHMAHMRRFAMAFAGTAEFLRQQDQQELSQLFLKVGWALREYQEFQVWQAGCREIMYLTQNMK